MKYYLRHCPPNPSLEYCQKLLLEVPKCDEIISEGGGSTIDVGKWLARELHVEHTAIPTTAGTGSEVTKYCVLMVDGKKTTLVDDEFIPTSYILDPKRVTSLPRRFTISSGLDALSQALESYWSIWATKESKRYSILAVNLILENLPKSLFNSKNEVTRMNMLLAANLSGRAINITRTNVCHAISYPLTEWYNIDHGVACALSLEYFANKAHVDINIGEFLQELNIPTYEIDKEKVANEVINSSKLKDCPFKVSHRDLLSCYR